MIDVNIYPGLDTTIEEDDFHVQLVSSYQFKVKAVDLAKLQSIRTMKNNKKKERLFRTMGLPVEVDQSNSSKKIVQLKPKSGSTSTNNTTRRESNTSTNVQKVLTEQRVSIERYRISTENSCIHCNVLNFHENICIVIQSVQLLEEARLRGIFVLFLIYQASIYGISVK